MGQVNSVPGVYNSTLSTGPALPTVANVDYDGVPEGAENTRENQPSGGGSILSYTFTSGSAYTSGTYASVTLTGGSGAGACGSFTVASNSGATSGWVTAFTVTLAGAGYRVGDTFAAPAIIGVGNGGFLATVTGIAITSSRGSILPNFP